MGGMIAARYAQLHGDELTAVVLSGPVIGEFALLDVLLAPDGDLDVAIDVAMLSRDDAVGAAYAADPLVWHGPFKRPTVEAMAATVAAIDAGGSLGALPMMWIHGDDGRAGADRRLAPGVERLRGDVTSSTCTTAPATRCSTRPTRAEVLGRRDRLHRRRARHGAAA